MPPRITVETGVTIPAERGHSYSQELSDAIKISIAPDENEPLDVSRCHFLQFITRQAPDMFRANLSEPMYGVEPGIAWETADTHYMDNPNTAKWRVDSNAHPNPFYDEGGAHEHGEDGSYSMYDQPAYAFEDGVFERIIGCTFVIANEQVIDQVLWSRQYTRGEEGEFSEYQYHIDDTVTHLPEWTMHCINDEYLRNSGPSGDRLPYTTTLYRDPIQSVPDAQVAMNYELTKLPPPPNWLLLQDARFSALITPPVVTAHAEEEHKETPNPTHTYREASENLRAQAVLQNTEPSVTDIANNSSISSTISQRK